MVESQLLISSSYMQPPVSCLCFIIPHKALSSPPWWTAQNLYRGGDVAPDPARKLRQALEPGFHFCRPDFIWLDTPLVSW